MRNLVEFSIDLIPAASMVNVVVSKDGKVGEKTLKLSRIKARSVLFIEVDKVKRINTFRKFKRKDVAEIGKDVNEVITFIFKDGILPDKWESSWDSIGSPSPSVQSYGRFATAARGLAPTSMGRVQIKRPMGSSMDDAACRVSNANSASLRSTTNSKAGFPMV